mmetsp:Transcript_19348/g.23619  ORF Transcript_19348/g.23619 Transcript_19348/m.23619 type:complete len:392 (+) Transcript_19348:347-1522(+)
MYPGMVGAPIGSGQRATNLNGTVGSNSADVLIQSLSCYYPQNKPRILTDVNNVLARVRSLRPDSDVYTSNEGISETLFKIHGTIPIRYNNNTYNIPMVFWLPSAYPLAGPLVYVVPTSTMEIAHNHEYVAPDGTVYLPYLNQWNVNRSNLVDLVDTCIALFSQIPPVRSKAPPSDSQRPPPAYTPTNRASYSNTPPPPPYPSYPGQQQPNSRVVQDNGIEEERQIQDALKIKLSRHLQQFYKDIRGKVDKEFEIQKALKRNEKRLQEAEANLEKQKQDLRSVISVITEKGVQLKSWLEIHEDAAKADAADEELNIDTAVTPADKWSEQLFDAVAEMNSIEDTLYYLDKALANDIIEIHVFLKEVRKLSRRQFIVKALAIKIMKKQQVQRMS